MAARSLPAVLAAFAVGGAVMAVAAAAVVFGGLYDISALRPHWQLVYSTLELAMRHSVQRHARTLADPPLDDPVLLARGAACYRVHCAACHGAPGMAPAPPGLGMQPLPGPLVDAAGAWRARELLWITRHGIRMSGMPAWEGRLADADLVAVAAFVKQQLPALHPADTWPDAPCELMPAPLPARAPQAFRQHGCTGCHVIPGVVGSERHVGPPLAGYGRRTHLKGRWPLTPELLAAWIRDPQALSPGSAMPDTGVGLADAQAMAEYLLRQH